MDANLGASRQACRAMTKQHAKTFYFASHTLPQQKRWDAYSVYAFCRYVDDQIDLAPDESARRAAYRELGGVLDLAYAENASLMALPWLLAFRETVQRRKIPREYFADLLTGVEMDQGRVRLQTWAELERYCYHVASVVGLIMTCVVTEPRPELLGYAKDLGTAMQLTNILRDIAEDGRNDRVYLPADELRPFGLTDGDILAGKYKPEFRKLMSFQIVRARDYYRRAQPGIDALPRDGSQLTVRLMSVIYGAILDEIEKVDYQVYGGRVRVTYARKLWLAWRTICHTPEKKLN